MESSHAEVERRVVGAGDGIAAGDDGDPVAGDLQHLAVLRDRRADVSDARAPARDVVGAGPAAHDRRLSRSDEHAPAGRVGADAHLAPLPAVLDRVRLHELRVALHDRVPRQLDRPREGVERDLHSLVARHAVPRRVQQPQHHRVGRGEVRLGDRVPRQEGVHGSAQRVGPRARHWPRRRGSVHLPRRGAGAHGHEHQRHQRRQRDKRRRPAPRAARGADHAVTCAADSARAARSLFRTTRNESTMLSSYSR
jgi:hypothetical protein